jgi:magnesium transporter
MSIGSTLIGILFAICGNVLMGVSLTLNKAVVRHKNPEPSSSSSHSSSGNLGFIPGEPEAPKPRRCRFIPKQLLNWKWWIATIILYAGEALNFVGYIKAPAYLIVLIGCSNVLVTQILCAMFIGEFFSSHKLLGSVLIGSGVTLLVISSPANDSGTIDQFTEALRRVLDEVPLVMFSVSISIIVFLLLVTVIVRSQSYASNKQSYVIPLVMYSMSACLMVITTKIIAIIVVDAMNHKTYFRNPFAYLIFIWWLLLVVQQLTLVNWMLAAGDATSIVPLMYVCYATTGMITSGIFFNEFGSRQMGDLFVLLLSVLCMFAGVYLVTRVVKRESGFWFCCPKFQFRASRTLQDLQLESAYPNLVESDSVSSDGSVESLSGFADESQETLLSK